MSKAKKLIEQYEILYEMANIDPRDHNFGVNVVIHVFQPGDKWLSHGPRLNIRKRGEVEFVVSLSMEPKKIKVVAGKSFLNSKELNVLLNKIRKYRIPFLMMSYDSEMTQYELMDLIHKIDNKEDFELINVPGYKGTSNNVEDIK